MNFSRDVSFVSEHTGHIKPSRHLGSTRSLAVYIREQEILKDSSASSSFGDGTVLRERGEDGSGSTPVSTDVLGGGTGALESQRQPCHGVFQKYFGGMRSVTDALSVCPLSIN